MKAILSNKAPKAIGPYSQAVRCGDWLFLSGQIPLDPVTGQVYGETIEEQTTKVFENLSGVLLAEGLTLSHLVKTTVYLRNMSEFLRFNEVYSRYFKPPYPARATVEVSRLPKDVLIEVEAIAFAEGTPR